MPIATGDIIDLGVAAGIASERLCEKEGCCGGQAMMGIALRMKTRRFPRWLIAMVLMLAAVVAIGGAAGWLMLRASLPLLDGRVWGNGVSATVPVDRDGPGGPPARAVGRRRLG